MTLIGRLSQLPRWVLVAGGLVWTALSTAGGALFSDYNSFRSSQVEASGAAVDSARDAGEELTPLLVKFARFALSEGTVTPEDRAEFDKIINKANDKALAVRNKYPSIASSYVRYSDALIGLKQSADQMKGPLTGKEFVKAVANYAVASDNFKLEAEKARSNYVGTLGWR